MNKSIRIYLLLLFALVLGFAVWMPGKAQDTGRAGLVVQYSDGSVVTRCVTFSESSITGNDLLNRSGLSVISSYGSMGATVCKIGNDGCSADDCFCQSPANYWSYWYLKDGSWQYSSLGASSRNVQSGDVEGWRWGSGSTAPALYTFSQICQEAANTPTFTSIPPSATTAPATETPVPTATNIPTDTPLSVSESQAHPTVTPRPSATAASLSAQSSGPVKQAAQSTATTGAEPLPEASPTTAQSEPPTESAIAAAPADSPAQPAEAQADEPTKVALAKPAGGQEGASGSQEQPASIPAKATAGAQPALARASAADAASSQSSLNGGLILGVAGYLIFGAILAGLLVFAIVLLVFRRRLKKRLLSFAIYFLTSALGIFSFLYPFFLPGLAQTSAENQMHASEMPWMITLLLGLCLLVLLYEVQSQAANARIIALLGVLIALNSVLRFIEIAMPGPGGFSPVFFLIILTGYAYGGRFGFLMGALTLLVSAFITGGVGPWLPYQMFTAGWIGMSAPLVRAPARLLGCFKNRREVYLLAIFGALWGYTYGAIMNLWSWPLIAGPAEQYWTPGVGAIETLHRYGVYYMLTSFAWDTTAALGNIALLLFLGEPILRALRRFQQRFTFSYQPGAQTTAQSAGQISEQTAAQTAPQTAALASAEGRQP